MSERFQIGSHQVWFEADVGLVCHSYRGVVREDEMEEVFDVTLRLVEAATPLAPPFLLTDGRNATLLSAGARRVMGQRAKTIREGYCAVYGTSFGLRAILNLVFKAQSLASPGLVTWFAADEAAARVWLTQRRGKYLREHYGNSL